jgi:hypothetical protein
MATFSMGVFDNEVVSSKLTNIAPILRVTTEIKHEGIRISRGHFGRFWSCFGYSNARFVMIFLIHEGSSLLYASDYHLLLLQNPTE